MNVRKPQRWFHGSLCVAAMMLGSGSARANVAAPLSYEVHVDGSTARVCLTYYGQLCPPDPKSPLVRKDLGTGRMVVVPPHCDEQHCFVDECVPPGTYQWGLADPGKCVGTSSLTYQGEGSVSQPAAPGCAPRLGPERPTRFTGTLPWNASNVACRGGYCSACNVGGPTGAEVVLAANGVALTLALWLLARRRRRARADEG
jgi:hypothetical protein